MPKNLSLLEVQATKEYKSLRVQEQAFIDAYIRNGGDAVAATNQAYKCKDERSAKAFSYQVLERPRILSVLYIYNNEDPASVELFLNLLWTLIQKKRINEAQVRAMTLYAEVNGWRKSKALTYLEQVEAGKYDKPEDPSPDSNLSNILASFDSEK